MNLTDVFKAHGIRVDYAPPAPAPAPDGLVERIIAAERELALAQPEPEPGVKLKITGTLFDENVIVTGEPEGGTNAQN